MSGAPSDVSRSWKLLSTSSRKMAHAEFQNERYVLSRSAQRSILLDEHFTDADAVVEAIVQDRTARGLEAVNVASQRLPRISTPKSRRSPSRRSTFSRPIRDWCSSSYVRIPQRFCSKQGGRVPSPIARAMVAMINTPPSSHPRRTGLRDGCLRTCEWSDGSHRRLATRGV